MACLPVQQKERKNWVVRTQRHQTRHTSFFDISLDASQESPDVLADRPPPRLELLELADLLV